MRARTIDEAMNFSRKDDPKGTLGIGMMGQIKDLARSQEKNTENMDEVGFFLSCAMAKRYDLMDYLLSKGLDINSQEHEILRVLAWTEQDDIAIHIIQKRGADLVGAIHDAGEHNEWKTVRRLTGIKEKIESTKPFPLKEDWNLPSELSGEKDLNKRVLDVIDGIKICAVNGDFVRDKDKGLGFIAFVEGGNHYADSYPDYKKDIKKDEVWLDDVHLTKPNDAAAIILHEMVERYQMKEHGLTYNKAHDIANRAEQLFRKKVHTGTGGKLWGQIYKKYRDIK
jgi:hypothetical protein